MKAIVKEIRKRQSELGREVKKMAREIALLEKTAARLGAMPRKKRRKKGKAKVARKALGRGIAAQTTKTKPVAPARKRGNGKASELEAKRRRAAELKGGSAGAAAQDTGGS